MWMYHFWVQNGSFTRNKSFFWKITDIFQLPIGPSLCKILKKSLEWTYSYEDAPFLDQKWAHFPK